MRVTAVDLGPVRLRWARIPADPPPVDPRLGASQVARAAALHGHRLASFRTSRAVVAALLAELAPNVAPVLDAACEACGEQHGPLRATRAPVVLSVSASGEWVMAGAALRSAVTALGVDLEADPRRSVADLGPLFAPRPTPTIRDWVRLEAALKADGRGMRVPPADVRLTADTAFLPGAPPIRVVPVDGPAGTTSAVAARPA